MRSTGTPERLDATRIVHVKGFARPPGYMRPPNAQAAGSSPLELSISLGSLRYPQTTDHTPGVIRCCFLKTGEWNCFENHIWLLAEVIPGNRIDLHTQNVP